MNVSDVNGTSPWGDGHNLETRVVALFVCLGILAVLIFMANSFVIYLYLHNRYLRTITNLCLVFLAVSDLLASLVAIPMIIVCSILNSICSEYQRYTCTAMDLGSRFVAISTILHLLIVSTERYIMIVHPMHYVKIVSKSKIIVVLVTAWCFSLSVVMIQLIWILKIDTTARQPSSSAKNLPDIIYTMTTFFGIVFPALCFMVFIYSNIYMIIRRQIKSIKRNVPASLLPNEASERVQKRGEKRAIVIFSLMVATFVLGWFPYFIKGFLVDLRIPHAGSLVSDTLLLFMRFATSLINPLLYTFFKLDFRKALKKKKKAKNRSARMTQQNETIM